MGPITLKGGTAHRAPYDDGDVPVLPDGDLSLHSAFGSFGSLPDADDSQMYGERVPGGHTPKRAGDELEARPPQRPRLDSLDAQDAGDGEFLRDHRLPAWGTPGSVVVTDSGLQHALISAITGRPKYDPSSTRNACLQEPCPR